jgi:glutamyl/glutaminyl-tRNA synthetase
MIYNTRFNPTADGALHFGHYFLVKMNEHAAHSSGGKFYVRIDNIQRHWELTLGHTKVYKMIDDIRKDIEWMQVIVDGFVLESDEEKSINFCTAGLGVAPEHGLRGVPGSRLFSEVYRYANTTVMNPMLFYPFVPYLTLHTVVSDCRLGINKVITGLDILSRHSLYCWFCHVLNYPQVEHVFLPRVANSDGSNMAKTQNSVQIQSLRKSGWTLDRVDRAVRMACLIDPAGQWEISNVKKGFQICL